MKCYIICKTSVEGIHCWPNCTIDEVDYLKYPHRHIFNIRACSEVSHTDRDIEFIQLGHKIKHVLNVLYYNEKFKCCYFASLSCESIAELILNRFKELIWVEVFEDEESGARVER